MKGFCKDCGIEKTLQNTNHHGGTSDRFQVRCRSCTNSHDKKRRDLNPIIHRDKALKKIFGIDINEYNKMFDDQKGCCAICKRHQSIVKRTLHVDHDHNSGHIRGLLCFSCNMRLGFIENKEFVDAATTYLNRSKIRLVNLCEG